MACIVMTYEDMAYIVMAYIAMACMVMADIVMAYIVMALELLMQASCEVLNGLALKLADNVGSAPLHVDKHKVRSILCLRTSV